MSLDEHTQRCRRWLDDQLEPIGRIRNANPRDMTFKAWRQATMTVLQRIWSDDPARVERFRRIAFRAPGARPEPEVIREWHRRGCDLAFAYLTELVQDLELHGAPQPLARRPDEKRADGGVAEDDFPLLELPGGDERAGALIDTTHLDDHVVDLGGPSGVLEPNQGMAADESLPTPPRLKVELPVSRELPPTAVERPATPPALHAIPAPVKPASEPAPAAAVAPAASASPAKISKTMRRPSVGTRLKDMLGLSKLEETPLPLAESANAPAQDSSEPAPQALAPSGSSEPASSAAPAPAPTSVFATQPRPLKRKPRRVESMESLVPESMRTPTPTPAPAPAPAPESPPVVAAAEPFESASTEPSLDADSFEIAANEFLKSSFVLGLTGKPVLRMSDATTFLDPDAVAVAALAADVARLGVEEGARASVRSMLLDLARQMDQSGLEWTSLRDAVVRAMEYPELARRLMPIVLPWLDRAA